MDDTHKLYKALKRFNDIAYSKDVMIKHKLKPGKNLNAYVSIKKFYYSYSPGFNKEYIILCMVFLGECVVFDNHRVLHGRVGYTMDPKGGNRIYNGCYVDWDEILSKFNLLRVRLEK